MCIFRLLQRFPCSRNPEQVELGVRATPHQFPLAPLHMHAGQAPRPCCWGAADSRSSSPEEIPSRQLDTGQIPIEQGSKSKTSYAPDPPVCSVRISI